MSHIEPPPMDMPDASGREHRRMIALAVRELTRAIWEGTGSVTLTPGATTTTVVDGNCYATSGVHLFPTSAKAAAAVGAGVVWAQAADGGFTVNHDNTADTDRTFTYALFG